METLKRVLDFLEDLFPASFSLPDDRSGLQVKACETVQKIAVDLELTPELLTWAIAEKIDLLYLHHPPIWTPLSLLSRDDPYFVMLYKLYHQGISVIAHHTNLDSAPGGLAEQWIKILALEGEKKPILPHSIPKFKIVTFVPPAYLEKVSQAIFSTGAGTIGNYKGCSFQISGTGTFIPQESAQPFVGTVGQPERVPETRLEVEVRADLLNQTVEQILSTHPYEEPVIDIYPLKGSSRSSAGLGRIIKSSYPLVKEELKRKVERVFSEACTLYFSSSNVSPTYQTIALCPGSGKSLLDQVIQEKPDVFITGELSHHEIQKLLFAGIDYLSVSHGRGEKRAMQEIRLLLQEQARAYDLKVEFLERKS
ncbi:MAG: Nif3-like dinuclear metal center hexameric protein [Atribacterota bacterium]|nr:Nif3-like dinuclear metal center hexameric protein [Atribacterota bacterium]